MGNIDLDAIARELGEDGAEAEPLTVTIKGKVIRCVAPADVSMFDLSDALAALNRVDPNAAPEDPVAQATALEAINGFLRVVIHPDDWPAFVAARPGPRLLGYLVAELPRAYGMTGLGEPPASVDSSPNTGTDSKPTSSASTESTFATSSEDAAVVPA